MDHPLTPSAGFESGSRHVENHLQTAGFLQALGGGSRRFFGHAKSDFGKRVTKPRRRAIQGAHFSPAFDGRPCSPICARADKLGAIRRGTGPKAPLRFDPDTIDDRFKALGAAGSAPASCCAPQPAKRATPVRDRVGRRKGRRTASRPGRQPARETTAAALRSAGPPRRVRS